MADVMIAPVMRVCTHCHVSKPADLTHFPPHKIGKYGIHSWCRPCKKLIDSERRARPDQLARQKAWRDANKDVVKKHNLAWRANNKSTALVAAWRAKNIERARELDRRKMRERRARDPAFRLMSRIRARLNSMALDKAGRRTEEIMGFSAAELRSHLERQFTKGMSWDNIGKWHIDHIIPVSSFNITSFEDADFRACWGLPNLRPLWAKDNAAKGAKRLTLV